MGNQIKSKVINLNHLGTVYEEESFLRDDKVKFVQHKIEERIEELKKFTKGASSQLGYAEKKDDAEVLFDTLRGHDTILIDGSRGSGKTTLLAKIRDEYKKEKKGVYVFRVIDPTLINIQNHEQKTNSDILLMFLSQVYTLVVRKIKEDRDDNKGQDYHSILQKIKEINNGIIKGYYADDSIDYNERLYSFNEGLKLDYHLHELFDQVCRTIKVEILVFMIDDIDMELSIAFNIIDVIRRYLGSPRVIPIVAMDSSQAYAVIKQHFFKRFALQVEKPIYEIRTSSDLDFLKSLPRAYMLKAFLPSRRIETDDMYTVYKYYNVQLNVNDKCCSKGSDDDGDTLSLKFKYTNLRGVPFNLDSKDLLSYFVNVVYGTYRQYGQNKSSENIYFIDYLENLSMRSFVSDMRNFLETIAPDGGNSKCYIINEDSMKTNLIMRFLDYPRYHNRKESVLVDVWGQFIENVNGESYHNSYYGDVVEQTFLINGHNTYDRYAKTYQRLWMQTYFLKKICIEDKTNDKKIIEEIEKMSIIKVMDINGIFELALRSFIPMHIVNRYINKSVDNTLTSENIRLLKSLSTDNLQELSQNLTSLEKKLSGEQKYFGGIDQLTCDIKNVHELLTHDWLNKENSTITHGSQSFFKSLAFFMEYSRFFTKEQISDIYDNKNQKGKTKVREKLKKFVLNYLPRGYDNKKHNSKKWDFGNINLYNTKLINSELKVFETSFGLVSINRFSKRLVENFSYIFNDIHKDKESKKDQMQSDYYFSIYICTFLNAFLVEFIESLKIEDIPIQKGYIDIEKDFSKKSFRCKECESSKYRYMTLLQADKNNLLFYNLYMLEKYFNRLDNKGDNRNRKKSLYSMVIFIVRVLKYYHVWSFSLRRTYGYHDIYIAKKLLKDSKLRGNEEFYVEEITIFLCEQKDFSSQSSPALLKINKKLSKKRETLKRKLFGTKTQNFKIDHKKRVQLRKTMSRWFYNKIFLKKIKKILEGCKCP